MALDKLVDSEQLNSDLTSIANAIRTKGGTSSQLVFPSGFAQAIANIPTGDGGAVSKGDVNFYDYDGTLVASKSKTEINAMTSDSDLPANPSHEGLTAQGWNWTVAQLKAQLTAMPDQVVNVGQMYITESGATEIDVEMHEGRLSPILTICVNGTIEVDWGDNTTPDTVTGTSLTTRQAVPHTYSEGGEYTIKISATSGSYAFYSTSSYLLLRRDGGTNVSRVYSACVKNIRLGSDINSIGNYAFYYCDLLSTITIPSSITSIGLVAFQYCYSLSSITIPSGITSISNSVFSACYSLSNITIPSSITSIDGNAFNNCYALSSITIPSGVTSIGSYAFTPCYSLSSIAIPSGVTSIGSNTFQSCASLSSVKIPSSVTSIGNSAFNNCYSLSEVTIPSSVTSIGNSAFYYCYSLSNITIPSSVTSIGTSAFSTCYSLSSVTIPSSVTSINSYMFQNCYSLSSITIPSSVTSISYSAFANCYGVSEYHFESATPPTLESTNVFDGIVSDCIIYVPAESVEAYKTETNWITYASYIQAEPA